MQTCTSLEFGDAAHGAARAQSQLILAGLEAGVADAGNPRAVHLHLVARVCLASCGAAGAAVVPPLEQPKVLVADAALWLIAKGRTAV